MQHGSAVFCVKVITLYKEREKQKCGIMHNLHSPKDIALETFESRKAELKDDDKDGY